VDAGAGRRWPIPNISSLARARGRLGADPLHMLFDAVAGLVGAAQAPGVFAGLHAIQGNRQLDHSDKPHPRTQADQPQDASRAVPHHGDGPAARHTVEDLLTGMGLVHCSSKPPGVELRGIEPLTFSMRMRVHISVLVRGRT